MGHFTPGVRALVRVWFLVRVRVRSVPVLAQFEFQLGPSSAGSEFCPVRVRSSPCSGRVRPAVRPAFGFVPGPSRGAVLASVFNAASFAKPELETAKILICCPPNDCYGPLHRPVSLNSIRLSAVCCAVKLSWPKSAQDSQIARQC